MSGRVGGVQAKLKDDNPTALYVHCCNHALDLVLQELARETVLVAETWQFVQGTAVLLRDSAKKPSHF